MPKPPKPQPLPSAALQASYMSRQTAASVAKANRPNKFINPVMGMSQTDGHRPTLLGGR